MKNKIYRIALVIWNLQLGCKIHRTLYVSTNGKLLREDIEMSCPSPLEGKWVL
jgi:hypothetical protein